MRNRRFAMVQVIGAIDVIDAIGAIDAIRRMCRENHIGTKYLTISAFRMKRQVIKYINDNGIDAINLHVVSSGSLAMEWSEKEILEKGARVLSHNNLADVVA